MNPCAKRSRVWPRSWPNRRTPSKAWLHGSPGWRLRPEKGWLPRRTAGDGSANGDSPDYSRTPDRSKCREFRPKGQSLGGVDEARYTLSATEVFRRGKEARRRRCQGASARSADAAPAEKIGAAVGVVRK